MTPHRIYFTYDSGVELDPEFFTCEFDYAALPVLDDLTLWEQYQQAEKALFEARHTLSRAVRRGVPLSEAEREMLAARRAAEAAMMAAWDNDDDSQENPP
jgi:hypothetical protein